jgi:hypothetical protein
MGDAAQEFVAAIMMGDGFGDHGSKPGHAAPEPRRHAAIVQRQIGASCSPGHDSSLERSANVAC